MITDWTLGLPWLMTKFEKAEVVTAYLRQITEAIEQQSAPGPEWPEPLRLPQPINSLETEALRSWRMAAEEERGAPVRIEFLPRRYS